MKLKVEVGNWKPYRAPEPTIERKPQLVEANRLYYLEVEQQRRERLNALSRMPRGRLLD